MREMLAAARARLLGVVAVSIDSAPREARPALGASLRFEGGRLIAVNAIRGSAAARAGLLPHDEIVSIDGARTTSELEARSVLHSLDEGTAIEMIVSRAGVVRVMSLTAATEPRVKITVRATDWSVLRDRWLQEPYRG